MLMFSTCTQCSLILLISELFYYYMNLRFQVFYAIVYYKISVERRRYFVILLQNENYGLI